MVRPVLLSALCLGVGFAAEPPTVETEGPDVVAINDTDSFRFVASGGETDPPLELGPGPWIRTGGREFVWHIEVDEPTPGGMEDPHPLDGTVTTNGRFEVPQDKPGSFSVSVSLREEWLDASNPQTILFWPLAKGELPPNNPTPEGELDTPRPTPAPLMPAFPMVPPLAAVEDGK